MAVGGGGGWRHGRGLRKTSLAAPPKPSEKLASQVYAAD